MASLLGRDTSMGRALIARNTFPLKQRKRYQCAGRRYLVKSNPSDQRSIPTVYLTNEPLKCGSSSPQFCLDNDCFPLLFALGAYARGICGEMFTSVPRPISSGFWYRDSDSRPTMRPGRRCLVVDPSVLPSKSGSFPPHSSSRFSVPGSPQFPAIDLNSSKLCSVDTRPVQSGDIHADDSLCTPKEACSAKPPVLIASGHSRSNSAGDRVTRVDS